MLSMPTSNNFTQSLNDVLAFNFPDDNLLDFDMSAKTIKNQRITPRYIRDDISIAICEVNSIFLEKEIFIELAESIDVSSRGMMLASTESLPVKKKIIVNLKFSMGKCFKIKAIIIHKSDTVPYKYGIKFEDINVELGDYLLETQKYLNVK
jgi:hypothetical protein